MNKKILMIIVCIVLILLIGSIALYRITNMEVYSPSKVEENVVKNEVNTNKNVVETNSVENTVTNTVNPEEVGDTGSFKNTMFETENYIVKLSSQKAGHPSNGSNFSTYFEYNKKNESSNISLDYFFVEKDVMQDYSDFNKLKKISINGKELRYSVDTNKSEAVFLYKNDDESYLKIVLTSGLVFDNKTGYIKDTLKLTNDFIKRKDVVEDLKKEIKFDIEKK